MSCVCACMSVLPHSPLFMHLIGGMHETCVEHFFAVSGELPKSYKGSATATATRSAAKQRALIITRRPPRQRIGISLFSSSGIQCKLLESRDDVALSPYTCIHMPSQRSASVSLTLEQSSRRSGEHILLTSSASTRAPDPD